jgi:hypothetical protein
MLGARKDMQSCYVLGKDVHSCCCSVAGVHFEGTTGVELAMALNMFLKKETNSSISWCV